MNNILYRRNNTGSPCYWKGEILNNKLYIEHGILGKSPIKDIVQTNRDLEAELASRINEKRKKGYKYISELTDNTILPVEETDIFNYVDVYLPYIRTASDGTVLPMLAKVFDNANNKLFNKTSFYYGQWKINGLRCFISAYRNDGDLFKPIGLDFQSREGTHWNSLIDLEEYLLEVLPQDIIKLMLEEEYVLDGEVYLPGHSVNEINHFVKDPKCKENKLLQYWCYDIAIQDTIQSTRINIRQSLLGKFKYNFDKNTHLNNKERFICLPEIEISNGQQAVEFRDAFIDSGFEGLILRNPNSDYQYGARNSAMIKYKRATDGKFKIIDIYPEGILRPDIPLFKLQNDINSETFEVHVGGSFEYQKNILLNKEKYIGRIMFVSYGERSGVSQVPFHVKETFIMQ